MPSFGPESRRAAARRRQRDRLWRWRRPHPAVDLAHDDLAPAGVEQLVQRRRQVARAVEIEAQRLELELRERDVGLTAQLDAQHGRRVAESRGRAQTIGRRPLHGGDGRSATA